MNSYGYANQRSSYFKNSRIHYSTFKHRFSSGGRRKKFIFKKLDTETGLYYYGARYLEPKTSRWISADPALGEYLPSGPVNDEARKRNGNLPGQGGVFNYVNMHVYHYAGNNPVKYVDPDGREPRSSNSLRGRIAHKEIIGYLIGRFGGAPQLYLPDLSAPKGTTKGGFLVDYSSKEGNITELYEIKPISYMSSIKGDRQLQGYVDRANYNAQKKGSSQIFIPGKSLLLELNGIKLDTLMFQGPDIYKLDESLSIIPGTITLTTDLNRPGMIFYSLDDGLSKSEINKIQEFINNIVPNILPLVILE